MPTGDDGKPAAEDPTPAPGSLDINRIIESDELPPGMTWRELLLNYLRVAASIEHSLMVQYLFAAYSLDPQTGADSDERSMIAGWQQLLLSIAKEEMGHLLTVQNVLCLLGAPVELIREYQFAGHTFTAEFKLEPLTIESAKHYVWAEMPGEEAPGEFKFPRERLFEILAKRERDIPPPPRGTHHVGNLYRHIIKIISNPARIPDSDLHEDSFGYQASWDDWGRGHNYKTERHETPDPKIRHESADLAIMFTEMKITEMMFKVEEEFKEHPQRTDVIIDRVASRSQAKAALTHIFEQGEAPKTVFEGSHAQRFAVIYRQFADLADKKGPDWRPTRPVVENPHTLSSGGKPESRITWPRSVKWANLFNLRYRMLLSYLSHTFKLARDGKDARLRGAVLHKVFGEMYNLKSIAGILVRLPLTDHPGDPRRAGPPFAMPDSLELPTEAIERWRLHDDLVQQAQELNGSLRADLGTALGDSTGTRDHELAYLRALQSQDNEAANWIEQVIAGLDPEMRQAT